MAYPVQDSKAVKVFGPGNGRNFEEGNNVAGKHTVRKKYATEVAHALRNKWPAAQIVEMIDQTWTYAVHRKSPKGMLEVLELLLNYGIGKPQQSLDVSTDASALLAEIMSNTAPLFPLRDGDAVDITVDGKLQARLEKDDEE